jgi:hypothetical protein
MSDRETGAAAFCVAAGQLPVSNAMRPLLALVPRHYVLHVATALRKEGAAMKDNGWQESRTAVVRDLQWRLERELRELENPALSATDRRYKAASAAHIEESLRCILEARSEREYEIAYRFLLGCVWPVSTCH